MAGYEKFMSSLNYRDFPIGLTRCFFTFAVEK